LDVVLILQKLKMFDLERRIMFNDNESFLLQMQKQITINSSSASSDDSKDEKRRPPDAIDWSKLDATPANVVYRTAFKKKVRRILQTV
jgi:hypothetical protein